MRAVIVTGKGVQDQELIYPTYRLDEAGWEVDIAARGVGHHGYGPKMEFHGIQGVRFSAGRDIPHPQEVRRYDMLVIPGGVKAIEHMRLDDDLTRFIAAFHAAGKVVAAICSGPLLLASAGILKGKRIACYPAWRVDIENAGAEFVDMAAVVDQGIATSTHYRHVGPWMSAALTAVNGYT